MTERVDIDLYQLDETPKALLLSLSGRFSQSHWIPRSFVDEPPALRMAKVDGVAVGRGRFAIERWKAEEVGFLGGDDENQTELF